jgi:hypothetical protein
MRSLQVQPPPLILQRLFIRHSRVLLIRDKGQSKEALADCLSGSIPCFFFSACGVAGGHE